MLFELLKVVLGRILDRRSRTLLAAGGVGIGVGTLVFMVNLTSSVAASVEERLGDFGAHTLTISAADRAHRRGNLTADDAIALRRTSFLFTVVSPLVQLRTAVRVCGRTLPVTVSGVVPQQHRLARHRVFAGRLVSDLDVERRRAVAVLSGSFVRQVSCNPFGRSLVLNGASYSVIGTLEPPGLAGGDDAVALYVPLTTLQARVGGLLQGNVTIFGEGRSFVPMEYVIAHTRRILRRRHRLAQEQPDDFEIRTKSEIASDAKALSDRTKALIAVVAAWSLVIAGIGIANSVFNSVLERVPQIGLQRAVGAKRRHVRTEYLLEAMCISTVGAVGGVVVGGLTSIGVAMAMALPPAVDLRFALVGVSGGALLGILAGTWPAMYAARLSPWTAMRSE